jgi:hypothetical protein
MDCHFCDRSFNTDLHRLYHEQDLHNQNLKRESHQSGGGRKQFWGKISKFGQEGMVVVPDSVKKTALYGLDLQKQGFEGCLDTGNKRMRQLATQKNISIEDIEYMYNWFRRHIYASYPTYQKWVKAGRPLTKEWSKRHGIMSWYCWGGTEAYHWVNSAEIRKKLHAYFP